MRMFSRGWLIAVLACVATASLAAPLDALRTADTQLEPWHGQAEIAYDAVNDTLDFLRIRASDPVYGGSNVGDYKGYHLRGTYQLPQRFSLHADWWQRRISYRADEQDLHSWQVAAQYNFFEAGHRTGSNYAVRLSAWGNAAGELSKSSPTELFGRTLNTVKVADPEDKQVQLDFLGSWRLSNRFALSAFAGAGKSRVSVGAVSGTYIDGDGCKYNLSFAGNFAFADLAAPCGNFITARFTTPGPDIHQEVAYDARYFQFGGQLQWHSADWRLSGGYHYLKLDRDRVDDAVVSRGGSAQDRNHILIGEIARKVGKTSAVFLRGQWMDKQFVGEIPFAYNSVTASKFASHYGLATVGFMVAY